MLSDDLSSLQELERDCVCCLTASCSGAKKILCLMLNCQLCRNSGEIVSDAELPVVQKLRRGCVCG